MSNGTGILCVEDAIRLQSKIGTSIKKIFDYRIAIGTAVSAEEYRQIMNVLAEEMRYNIVKLENPRKAPFLPKDLDITAYTVSDVLKIKANSEQTVLVRIPDTVPDLVVEDITICATERGFFCAGGPFSVYPAEVQRRWTHNRQFSPLADWFNSIPCKMVIFGAVWLGWRFWSDYSNSKTSKS